MNKYERVCEIATENSRDTKKVLDALHNTNYHVLMDKDYEDRGVSIYVIKPVEEFKNELN